MKQTSFQRELWAHRFSHGGQLRQQRAGRRARPLSSREPIHLVFKTNKGLSGAGLRSARRFSLVQKLIRKYALKFHVKVEQISVQFDHIHMLVRITRRSLFQHFLRVVAGQIAQQFQKHGLSLPLRKRSVTDTPGDRARERSCHARDRGSRSHEQGTASRSQAAGAREHDTTSRDEPVRSRDENVRVENRAALSPASIPIGKPKTSAAAAGSTTASSSATSHDATRALPPLPLWKYRPFTRVVRGWKASKIVRDYIQLNEKEATGEIPYSKRRLRRLIAEELSRLWS